MIDRVEISRFTRSCPVDPVRKCCDRGLHEADCQTLGLEASGCKSYSCRYSIKVESQNASHTVSNILYPLDLRRVHNLMFQMVSEMVPCARGMCWCYLPADSQMPLCCSLVHVDKVKANEQRTKGTTYRRFKQQDPGNGNV